MNSGGAGVCEKSPLAPQPAATAMTNGQNEEASSGCGGIKPAPTPAGGRGGEGGGAGGNGGEGDLKKGPWTAAEDAILIEYVKTNGEGNWNSVRRNTGLARCGKSCRLRWANHLRPNLKKGSFSPDEELLILRLHAQLGNKWARMAALLPGRTDNEIKNYWNTRMKRRKRTGLLVSLDFPKPVGFSQHGFTSPCTPPSLQKSSAMGLLPSPPKAKYSAATLPPLLDFISFAPQTSSSLPSTPQALSPFWQRSVYNNQLCFQSPLSPSLVTPPPNPNSLFQQAPLLFPMTTTTMQFNLGNYDISRQTQPQPLAKVELPSTQLYPELDGFNDGSCSAELLDALLQDASGIGDKFKVADLLAEPAAANDKESSSGIEIALSQSEFMDFDIGIEMVNETSKPEPFSSLFEMPPAPRAMGLDWNWYTPTAVGGECKEIIPKGKQAVVKDGSEDETSLEINHSATSYSITNVEEQDWNINSFCNLSGHC